MYDASIISSALNSIQPSIEIHDRKSGPRTVKFELRYSSLQEVNELKEHLDSLIDIDLYNLSKETSNVKIELKRPLNEDELILIENEKTICQWDCNYFQDRYYKILDATGKWINFTPVIPQLVNRRIRARLNKKKLAIRKWTVKARQQGETTDSEGVVLHRVAFHSDVRSLNSSRDSDSSEKMGLMFTDGMNQLPWWNRPHLKAFETGKEYFYDNGSLFDLGWGTQKSIGRGRTPLVSHNSELPFYKYPEQALEEGLFQAMHESEWMMQLEEGTAEVRDDYFHKKTLEVIAGMEAGTTSWVICFHPWCARRDLFPTDTWIRARSEAFEKWMPKTETIAHATKLRNWVLNNEDYRAEFGSNWYLPREQMFYYEIEKDDAIKRNALHKFLKEKPSDIEEAFQNAGHTIYPITTIIHLSDQAQSKTPEVYKLKGDPNEVNPETFPEEHEIDYSRKIIDIKCRWNLDLPSFNFQFVPILFNGWQNFDPQNKILIWEHPDINATYGSSVDTSDGLGINISDDMVKQVVKKGTMLYKDKQVCEFASASLPPKTFWPWDLAINTYYSPKEQLLYCPEINKGSEVMNEMINRGWENIVRMLDMAKLEKDIWDVKTLGWFTNTRSRPDMVNNTNAFLLRDWVEIYSMPLIQELKDMTKKKTISPVLGLQRDKILGKKDNRFIALAIVLYSLHINEFLGLEKSTWEQRIANENSVVELKSFPGFSYEQDDSTLINPDYDEEFDLEQSFESEDYEEVDSFQM